MKFFSFVHALCLFSCVRGYVTKPSPRAALSSKPATTAAATPTSKSVVDLKKTATGAFAAFTIASSAVLGGGMNVLPADAASTTTQMATSFTSSTQVIAETVTRQGVYKEYEVDVGSQQFDDARSTFKEAKETKSKKGKYTALLAVLIVGSFVIPMAQYFWYVRDDDSSDKFFAEDIPDPKEKKGWF